MADLRLVQRPDPGPLPTLAEHAGRRIEWEAWHDSPVILCPNARSVCGHCGEHESWTSWGLAQPRPGETVEVEEDSTRVPGRTITRRRPARPLRRVVALRCAGCRDTRMFDTGIGGTGWTAITDQPSLLDLLEDA